MAGQWGRMQDMGLWGLIGLVWTPGDLNDFYSVAQQRLRDPSGGNSTQGAFTHDPTNQRPVFRSRDHPRPIRGQDHTRPVRFYSGRITRQIMGSRSQGIIWSMPEILAARHSDIQLFDNKSLASAPVILEKCNIASRR